MENEQQKEKDENLFNRDTAGNFSSGPLAAASDDDEDDDDELDDEEEEAADDEEIEDSF